MPPKQKTYTLGILEQQSVTRSRVYERFQTTNHEIREHNLNAKSYKNITTKINEASPCMVPQVSWDVKILRH